MPTHAFGPDFVSGELQGQCAASLGFAPPTTAPSCIASTLNVPNLTIASATHFAATPTFPEVCVGDRRGRDQRRRLRPGFRTVRGDIAGALERPFPVPRLRRYCGSVSPPSFFTNMVDGPEALPLGYATVFTDAGHEQDPTTPDLTWAVSETGVVNMPAIIDYQFRAVHQVTVATKQYVEAYYSQPIDHAYFDGCSNGGRQSLMKGERYPVDYDGLVAGDAAIGTGSNFTEVKAFIPTLAYIPHSTLAQVDTAVKASCDALDGVTDGLIQNPALCSFVPSSLVRGGVLTASQAAALQSYITRLTDPSGAPLYPGMSISDLSTAGFEGAVEISAPATDPTAAEPWGAKGVGPRAWIGADATIRALIEEDQSFDVNNDWPVMVSAAGNVIPDATLALGRQRRGAGFADDPTS
jgi:hypothetical protein